MRNAPPIVPGMPDRNSRPRDAGSRARCSATLRSRHAAPQRSDHAHRATCVPRSPCPAGSTTPGTPPSRTSRFEPTPDHRHGHVGGLARRGRSARSSASAGVNRTSAGTADAEPRVLGQDWRSRGTRPRRRSAAGRRSAQRTAVATIMPCSLARVEFGRQGAWAQLRDVAGAEADHHVATAWRCSSTAARELRGRFERDDSAVAVVAQAFDERVRRRRPRSAVRPRHRRRRRSRRRRR
jgi:hypothetical protein